MTLWIDTNYKKMAIIYTVHGKTVLINRVVSATLITTNS